MLTCPANQWRCTSNRQIHLDQDLYKSCGTASQTTSPTTVFVYAAEVPRKILWPADVDATNANGADNANAANKHPGLT